MESPIQGNGLLSVTKGYKVQILVENEKAVGVSQQIKPSASIGFCRTFTD